jgi:integrase
MQKALTDRFVAGVKPSTEVAQVDYFDVGYSGLALRVGRRDKVWCYFHRAGGKLHRMRLGRYPEMSLAEARDAWLKARKALAEGGTVSNETDSVSNATVKSVLAEWFRAWSPSKRPNSLKAVQVRMRDIVAAWGERNIGDITKRDVRALLDGVLARTTKQTQALLVFATLRQFFDWCLRRDIIAHHPMQGLKRSDVGRVSERDRVLTDDELAKLMQFCRSSNQYDPGLAAIHLLVLTGARTHMIAELHWNEINGDNISFPAERMKAKQAFDLPITPQVRAVIDSIPRIHGCSFVFGRSLRFDRIKARLDAATLIKDWVLHDIRRTVSTGMQRFGIREDVIDAVQAHSKAGVKKVYQRHTYAAEKREALERWGAFVHSLR